jgi:hypothetical protein
MTILAAAGLGPAVRGTQPLTTLNSLEFLEFAGVFDPDQSRKPSQTELGPGLNHRVTEPRRRSGRSGDGRVATGLQVPYASTFNNLD